MSLRLTFPKPAREQFPSYVDFVRSLPCCVPGCGRGDVQPHHHIARGAGGSDLSTVPLCAFHHLGDLHASSAGSFWERHGLDPWRVIAETLAEYVRTRNA
jgi:hypothetical protein